MAAKDLINLGTTPDSGTGDSARKGGLKINNLFADLYSNFGDNPIGNDPNGAFYGYRRPFRDFEYKVGELHPAGKYTIVQFKSGGPTTPRDFINSYGYGVDSEGEFVDSNVDGIPNIFRDSEWYFLSRGEKITADLREVSAGRTAHFVLPLARAGDVIEIRDSFSSWQHKNISIWTTPYEFRKSAQITEWKSNTPEAQDMYPDSDAIAITDHLGVKYFPVYKKINFTHSKFDSDIASTYPKLYQKFIANDGKSYVNFSTAQDNTLIFTYQGPDTGWILRRTTLISTQQIMNARQDNFEAGDWIQWNKPDLTVGGELELRNGQYLLPVAPSTKQSDIDNAISTPVYQVYRRMTSSMYDSEALIQVNNFLYDYINNEQETSSNRDTFKRLKAVFGRDSDDAFINSPDLDSDGRGRPVIYNGFADATPAQVYKQVNVGSIVDTTGNILLITDEPFPGMVQLLVPGARVDD
jgi:hypothetical protein